MTTLPLSLKMVRQINEVVLHCTCHTIGMKFISLLFVTSTKIFQKSFFGKKKIKAYFTLYSVATESDIFIVQSLMEAIHGKAGAMTTWLARKKEKSELNPNASKNHHLGRVLSDPNSFL